MDTLMYIEEEPCPNFHLKLELYPNQTFECLKKFEFTFFLLVLGFAAFVLSGLLLQVKVPKSLMKGCSCSIFQTVLQ